MASEQSEFHIFFLPYLAPGHMIPALDLARLFATRGVKCSIVTTPLKMPFFAEAIETNTQRLGGKINLFSVKFPYEEPGFPKECKSTKHFFKAIAELQHPLGALMEELHPNCLVADFQFPWANSVAKKFGVPCLSFDVCSYFYPCVSSNLKRYQPHKEVSSDSEHFVVPGLPHPIKLRRADLAPYEKGESENWMIELVDRIWEGQRECYGVIKNSFYELEPDYADYYEKGMGFKHWHIGPLLLYIEGKENEGSQIRKNSIDVKDCLRWLDEKQDSSVIYICFGSMSNVADSQLDEIARALESLTQNFILVVRNKDDTNGWVLDGFEDQVKGRGLVIRGWAQQRLILDHRAIGGFVTHCGWNSILEGVVAGLPMVTWPRHAEQFYNEKFVTDVLKIGVPVGVMGWAGMTLDGNGGVIGKDEIVKAIAKIMVGKEAEDMKKRAQELKEMARRAIQEGGSSYSDLSALIEELKAYNDKVPTI